MAIGLNGCIFMNCEVKSIAEKSYFQMATA